jgi:hypothetical protein
MQYIRAVKFIGGFLRDVRRAGVNIKTPPRQERTLKIMVANKSRMFRHDEQADTLERGAILPYSISTL